MTSPAMEEARSIPTRDTAAYLSLAKTMRRLAGDARIEAEKWNASGNDKFAAQMRGEEGRLLISAEFYQFHATLSGAGK